MELEGVSDFIFFLNSCSPFASSSSRERLAVLCAWISFFLYVCSVVDWDVAGVELPTGSSVGVGAASMVSTGWGPATRGIASVIVEMFILVSRSPLYVALLSVLTMMT